MKQDEMESVINDEATLRLEQQSRQEVRASRHEMKSGTVFTANMFGFRSSRVAVPKRGVGRRRRKKAEGQVRLNARGHT